MTDRKKSIAYIFIIFLTVAGVFVIWNISKESVRKGTLRNQISDIKHQLSLVDHYYDSCSGAYWAVQTNGMEELGREYIRECANTQNFIEFTNDLVIEPELSDVKKDLIKLSSLLNNFSIEVIVEENKGVDYRDKADREIPLQKTEVLESIKKVELENNL